MITYDIFEVSRVIFKILLLAFDEGQLPMAMAVSTLLICHVDARAWSDPSVLQSFV